MNEAKKLAALTGASEATILSAAQSIADMLAKDCGGVDEAVALMSGKDAAEVAQAYIAEHVKTQKALAVRALTNPDKFSAAIYKMVKAA